MAAFAKSERQEEERRRRLEEEERKRTEEEELANREKERVDRVLWWRYARRCLLAPEPAPSSSDGAKPIRIAFASPLGWPRSPTSLPFSSSHATLRRSCVKFDSSRTPAFRRSFRPTFDVLSHSRHGKYRGEMLEFCARDRIPSSGNSWTSRDGKAKLGDIDGLRNGGVVVVEMRDDSIQVSNGGGGNNDSDGYETEED